MRAVDAVAQLGNLRLPLRGGNGPILRVYPAMDAPPPPGQ
jgi:hypothetical protein